MIIQTSHFYVAPIRTLVVHVKKNVLNKKIEHPKCPIVSHAISFKQTESLSQVENVQPSTHTSGRFTGGVPPVAATPGLVTGLRLVRALSESLRSLEKYLGWKMVKIVVLIMIQWYNSCSNDCFYNCSNECSNDHDVFFTPSKWLSTSE